MCRLSLAVDGDRLYLATYWRRPGSEAPQGTVRVIDLGAVPITAHGIGVAPGAIETIVGAAGARDADGGRALDAALSYVPGMALDSSGGLYVAEQLRNRVRFIDGNGVISTFAGTGGGPAAGAGGLDRPATQVTIDSPVDVKVGSGRRVFVAEAGTGRVLEVDSAGLIRLSTGDTRPTRCASTGPATSGEEHPSEGQPYSVVAGDRGDAYFVNLGSRRVMHRDAVGTVTVALAAGDSCPAVGPCTASTPTELRWPAALALVGDGLYVYDVIGAKVLFLNRGERTAVVHGVPVGPNQVGIVAGTGAPGLGGDGGPATAAQLGGQGSVGPGQVPALPSILLTEGAIGDIAVDGEGNLFIGDAANRRVRQVSGDGSIETIGGVGAPPGAQDCCTEPSGLAVDRFGNLYVSDMATRQVWFVNRSSVTVDAHGRSVPAQGVAAVAGSGARGVGGDGPGLEVSLYQPTGLATDGQGNLYIAEYRDQTIRRLDASGVLSTVAGTGAGGFNGDGLPPRQAALFNPTDVAVDGCGNLLVADFRNDRLRRVNLAAPCETAASSRTESQTASPLSYVVAAGGALVLGGGVAWWRLRRNAGLTHRSLNAAGLASRSSRGVAGIPLNPPLPRQVHLGNADR